jgi:hypothetical protein
MAEAIGREDTDSEDAMSSQQAERVDIMNNLSRPGGQGG